MAIQIFKQAQSVETVQDELQVSEQVDRFRLLDSKVKALDVTLKALKKERADAETQLVEYARSQYEADDFPVLLEGDTGKVRIGPEGKSTVLRVEPNQAFFYLGDWADKVSKIQVTAAKKVLPSALFDKLFEVKGTGKHRVSSI